MKRVLIFSLAYEPFIGGAEVALREITKRLPEIRFDVITLRFDSQLPRKESHGNVCVYRVGWSKKAPTAKEMVRLPLYLNKVFYPLTALLQAVKLDRKYHYDLIWSFMSYMAWPALFFQWWHRKIPYVLSLQDGDPISHIIGRWRIKPIGWLLRTAFRRARVIQTISNYLADFAETMGYEGKVVVIPNGVDVVHFSKKHSISELTHLENELGKHEVRVVDKRAGGLLSQKDIFLVTTGRLVEKNGVRDLVKAIEFLPRHIKLLMVGDGPLMEEFRPWLKRGRDTMAPAIKGNGERVKFIGFVDYAEIPKYLHVSDIFIRPSLSEGMGNSFIEAMAAGLPVIATPVGGIVDFLIDPDQNPDQEPTGLFCQVHNPQSIAEQVKRLMADEKLKEKLVTNARKLVAKKYDWNLIAARMEKEVFAKSLG